jgi:predicted RNA methylase
MGVPSKPGVFRSRLEDLMPAVELGFPPTPGFGDYRPYLEHAVSHPAKANVRLLEFLILKYTNEGDVILDPMAGSGSTGVVAALHGRNAILVEIEPKFYEFIVRAKERVERAEILTKKGWIVPILGDARRLSGLLTGIADICITSPPYAETALSGSDPERRAERLVRAGYDPRDFLGGRARNAVLKHYDEPTVEGHGSSGPGENIGRLPLGPVDAIVTSPPYVQQHQGGRDSPEFRHGCIKERYQSEDSIGHLPLGPVDAIITSPPYSEGIGHDPGDNASNEYASRLELQKRYTRQMVSEGNIARLRLGNATDLAGVGDFGLLYRRLLTKKGKPTYLSEMLLVYSEMRKVLREGGRAIVIVKPFVKNRQVIDLPYLTYLLMSKVAFTLEALYKLRLETLSFWRILHFRKNPDIPRLEHEYVIVAK